MGEKWDLIVRCMHWSGRFLTARQQWEVYLLADGFGDYSNDPKGLAGINGGWDWSHIRDSSPEAIDRMLEKIKQFQAEEEYEQ